MAETKSEDHQRGDAARDVEGDDEGAVAGQVAASGHGRSLRLGHRVQLHLALHQGEAQEEERREHQEPGRRRLAEEHHPAEDAEGEERRDHHHVEDRHLLQAERIGEGEDEIGERHGEEGRPEQEQASGERPEDQDGRGGGRHRDRQVAGGDRPEALADVAAVGLEVEEVVDEIGAAGEERQEEEGEDEVAGRGEARARRHEEERHEDEEVLQPLVRPRRPEERRQERRRRRQLDDAEAVLLGRPPHRWREVDAEALGRARQTGRSAAPLPTWAKPRVAFRGGPPGLAPEVAVGAAPTTASNSAPRSAWRSTSPWSAAVTSSVRRPSARLRATSATTSGWRGGAAAARRRRFRHLPLEAETAASESQNGSRRITSGRAFTAISAYS